MTIYELYEWAEEHNVVNYEIHIQYRDGGGFYLGYDTLNSEDIEISRSEKTVTF